MKSKIEEVVGKRIIESISGGGAGSILKLKFENNFYFMIYSAWRIETDFEIKVTSRDNTDVPGLISDETKKLTGEIVNGFSWMSFNDFSLDLSNGSKLTVFCDVGPSESEYPENWEYHDVLNQKIICSNNKGKLEEHDRN